MTAAATSPLQTARLIASDIKLHHSVFALPFALLAAFMAGPWPTEKLSGALTYSTSARSRFAGQLALIVLAMIFARTVAMLSNRVLDREIDKRNPRTANRAIPSGRLSVPRAVAGLVLCASGFMLVCAAFGLLYRNWWPLALGLPVLMWISAYPLLKRFTALCHIYLGSSLAISPIAAAIAINPYSVDPASAAFQPAICLLSAMVLCWVAGFDIVYALQDVRIDREQNLFSIPSRLGVEKALWISRGLHVLAIACVFAAAAIDGRFGLMFATAACLVLLLLIYEHAIIARFGASRMTLAFFTLNGVISCVLGVAGIADVVLV